MINEINEKNTKIVDKAGYQRVLDKIESLRISLAHNKTEAGYYSDKDDFDSEEKVRIDRKLQKEIDELTVLLTTLKVVENSQEENQDIIKNGDTLVIIDHDYEIEETYKIVGSLTPNLSNEIGEITLSSPLGKAILGKKVGDVVTFEHDNGSTTVTIVKKLNEKKLIKRL